jgi:phosphohistidine phosphatase SixA
MKAFRQVKAHESLELRAEILAGLQCWVRHDQWTKDGGRYTHLAGSWLRGQRWLDETVVSKAPRAAGNRPAWLASTGFDNVQEAANNFCWEHTAHQFCDGKRIAEEAGR